MSDTINVASDGSIASWYAAVPGQYVLTSSSTISVNTSDSDKRADVASEYVASTNNENTSTNLYVSVNGGDIWGAYRQDHSYMATINVAQAGNVTFQFIDSQYADNSGTFTITAYQPGEYSTVSISKTTDGAEGGAQIKYTVSRTGSWGNPLFVNVHPTFYSGDSEASAADIGSYPTSVTINPGSGSCTFSIPVVDDSLYELTERLHYSIDPSLSYAIGTSSADAYIADNDAASGPQVSISQVSNGSESGTPVQYKVTRDGGGSWANPLVVSIAPHYLSGAGEASAADISNPPSSVTIPANTNSQTFSVTVVDDAIYESTENLRYTVVPSGSYVVGGTGEALAQIGDNDPAPVQVSISQVSDGAEGGASIQFRVTRTGSTASSLDIAVAAQFLTGPDKASPSDVTNTPSSVTIPSGASSYTFSVGIVDDTTPELREQLRYAIASSSSYSISGTGYADAYITDNDTPTQAPPSGNQPSPKSDDPVDYFTGALVYNSTDLASSGGDWAVARSFANLPGQYQQNECGNGFVSADRKYLRNVDGDIQIVLDGTESLWFDQCGTAYSARFFGIDKLAYDSGLDTFTWTDAAGQVTTFWGFAGPLTARRGQVRSIADTDGNVTSFTYNATSGLLETVSRTAGGVTAAFTYTRIATGANAGLVASVTLTQNGTTAGSVEYSYYTTGDTNGSDGDLKLVTIKSAAGAVVTQKYHRYYTSDTSTGYAHALKYIFDGDSYFRLKGAFADPTVQTDAAVAAYADYYYEYDSAHRVTKQTAGSLGTFTFAYTDSANPDSVNSWRRKTVETLPDGSRNTVYLNYLGEVMLKAHSSGSNSWVDFYEYDSDGRMILHANPSAVTGYNDGFADLLSNQSGNYQYLSDNSGLIELTSYYASTTATATSAGGVAGYESDRSIRNGETATSVLQYHQEYFAVSGQQGSIYPMALYRNYSTDGASRTTSYVYVWETDTTHLLSRVTTLATVSADQNGSGSSTAETEVYDSLGRTVWAQDAAGYLTYTAYDAATGAVVTSIVDADPAQVSGAPVAAPSRGVGLSAALHLMTSYEVDAEGRVTKVTDPAGRITITVYSADGSEQRVYRGWTGTSATGPVEITIHHKPSGGTDLLAYDEIITADMPTLQLVNGRPTGSEAITIGNIKSLTRVWLNASGQVAERQEYFSFAGIASFSEGITLGTASNNSASGNYHSTTYGFDSNGAVAWVKSATGTVTHTFYDTNGRLASSWVGLDDLPASDLNSDGSIDWRDFRFYVGANGTAPAGTDLVEVSANEYDGGSVGDGNLTKQSAYPAAGTERVTRYLYDWQNHLTWAKAGCGPVAASEDESTNRPLTHYIYNGYGELAETDSYDGDGIDMTDSDGIGSPTLAANRLRTQARNYYDDLGRVYRSEQYMVDQGTGVPAATPLATNYWRDARGNLVKQLDPTGLATKWRYDGAGRLIWQTWSDAIGDTGYSDAQNVTGDTVLEEMDYTYGTSATGNVGDLIQTTHWLRFHDSNGTGRLGMADMSARPYYVFYYYDKAGRQTAVADYGTNGGATLPTYSSSSIPTRSATVLVTSYAYNAAGLLDTTTDPRGIASKSYYDALGRTLFTVAAWDGTYNPTSGAYPSSSNQNQTTAYTYDGLDNVLTMTARLPGSTFQTTQYIYGVSTSTGSSINSNDILSAVQYPDKTSGSPSSSQQETYTVNALGDKTRYTDRNGTVHSYVYDVVGRLTGDSADSLGNGVDGTVRYLGYTYNALGLGEKFTSYSSTTSLTDATTVNQDLRQYNGLGQLTTEYQSVAGAVNTSTTPNVQYAYDLAHGARQTKMTYPSGRILGYTYGTGVDNDISRVTALCDQNPDGTTIVVLENELYLGLSTIVRARHPENTMNMTLISPGSSGDAGDQYTGLDRFGRTVDIKWTNYSTNAVLDEYQYGYDPDGNVLYKNNMVSSVNSELYHANGSANGYDKLNRITDFRRGTLSDTNSDGVPDTVTTSSMTVNWNLDATGNWSSTTVNGTVTNRTNNKQNQITTQGVSYDADGNTATDERGQTYTYDAWNRMMTVSSGGTQLTAYQWDALGRKIGMGRQSIYYSKDWQIIQDVKGTVKRQYVWSPAYVDDLILRDDDADGNSGTGSEGKTGSGLERRLYAMHDANWDITGIVNLSTAVVERYVYDAYGTATVKDGNWNTIAGTQYYWLYLYQGGRWDDTTNLIHFRNREYSSTLGRWMQTDPLGYPDGANRYQYELSGPVDSNDPTGLLTEHIQSDWAGRQILLWWLTGKGVERVLSGGEWGTYMKADPDLAGQVRRELISHASGRIEAGMVGKGPGRFFINFDAEVENGEGIVGYNYLHGTDGGFDIEGKYDVKKSSKRFSCGTAAYAVEYGVVFRWNDRIDPNAKYTTDQVKSIFGRVITLGQAQDYDIHIQWSGSPTLYFDSSGRFMGGDGYPFDGGSHRPAVANPGQGTSRRG